MAVSDLELQTQHYWKTMSAGLAKTTLTEFQDDMEVLAMYADSTRLRDAAERNVARYNRSFALVRAARAK
jgi:hypothetical protein